MKNVIDINQDQFIDEVIEKSKTIPIIVDFWAPWCGVASSPPLVHL